MTFNIGSQSAGVINNVAGDQRIAGGQHGSLVATREVRNALEQLRGAVGAARLDEATAADLRRDVDALAAEAAAPQPDAPAIAARLERVTRVLAAGGALATAGAALVAPLQTLAAWLGALGEPVLRLLPLLG